MATIFDVAEKAGVSKSTVSRVINHAPGVAEPLRQAVLEAMSELEYQPSPRRPGRKPKSRRGIRSGNVLLMYSGAEAVDIYRTPVMAALIHSAEEALAEAGISLVISAYHQDKPLPPALTSNQIDGVLLLGSTRIMTESMCARLSDIPFILLMRSSQDVPGSYDRVLYDNHAVGLIAADYLIDLKHRNVVLFNHDPSHPAFAIRQQNFVQAMRETKAHVLEIVSDATISDPQKVARSVAAEIKRAKPSPTAICTLGDSILPHLYTALRAEGLNPESDLSIVSCNNEESTMKNLHPRPASIDIRADFIGRLAVRQLQWRLAQPEERGAVTLSIEPELVRP